MPRRKKYDKRVTVWMTTAMYNNQVRAAGCQRDVAKLIRRYFTGRRSSAGEAGSSNDRSIRKHSTGS